MVLTVADIERTCRFYVDGLGMERRVFAGGRVALHFGGQKINLHAAAAPIVPHARRPTPGSADLCFVTATPIADVMAALAAREIAIIEGPVERSGARGPLLSIYCVDPDGNLVEIANHV